MERKGEKSCGKRRGRVEGITINTGLLKNYYLLLRCLYISHAKPSRRFIFSFLSFFAVYYGFVLILGKNFVPNSLILKLVAQSFRSRDQKL